RHLFEPNDIVAGHHDLAVGGDSGWRRRMCADRDDDVLGRDPAPALVRPDGQGMGIGERRLAVHDGNVVAPELIFDDALLARENLVDLGQELLRGGTTPGRPGPVLAAHAIEEEDSLAQRLTRDGAGPETHPTEAGLLLDDGYPLAELGRLNGRALAGRTAAYAHEVIVVRRGRICGHRGTHVYDREDSIAAREIRPSQDGHGWKMNGVAEHCPR